MRLVCLCRYAVVFAFFFEGRLVSPLYALAFALTLSGLVTYHRALPPTFATFATAERAALRGSEDCAANAPKGGGLGGDEEVGKEAPVLQSPLYAAPECSHLRRDRG